MRTTTHHRLLVALFDKPAFHYRQLVFKFLFPTYQNFVIKYFTFFPGYYKFRYLVSMTFYIILRFLLPLIKSFISMCQCSVCVVFCVCIKYMYMYMIIYVYGFYRKLSLFFFSLFFQNFFTHLVLLFQHLCMFLLYFLFFSLSEIRHFLILQQEFYQYVTDSAIQYKSLYVFISKVFRCLSFIFYSGIFTYNAYNFLILVSLILSSDIILSNFRQYIHLWILLVNVSFGIYFSISFPFFLSFFFHYIFHQLIIPV